MLWNPLNDAADYRQKALDKRNRGGGHVGKVYRTQAAMLEDRITALSDWERAVYEARYCVQAVVSIELEHLRWNLSEEYWSGDVPF